MKKTIFFVLIIMIAIGCKNTKNKSEEQYKKIGDSIATNTQALLLKNLTTTINEKGMRKALEYCNINAEKIINTKRDNFKILSIQRLSDKNRNPKNKLFSDLDKSIFDHFKSSSNDTAILQYNAVVYYKPIKIMMPSCLKCHGNKDELDIAAWSSINDLYPNDLAINYKEGDLRGIWKIIIKK